ncbi:AmmeMemoRadiSam system protein B [Methylovirgula sp. 4M-Z18]|uniref:AmmeMemoRadiSam system protein B n=1 Tax=Methylovirgula sp. 4M-Z18 TaxID=2293567 RepID=UPI001314F242|nr:AmmeMemoRadiSam system protein B [Methylovirgula sp. 4M-Z18]
MDTISISSVHPPQVAGSFYPATAAALTRHIDRAWQASRSVGLHAKMAVVPHAGIVYSGAVAASALRAFDRPERIKRLVILGPAHRVLLRGIALHPAQAFATPLGEVPVAWRDMASLRALDDVRVDATPFAGEHSLEMVLIMAQRLFGDFEIIPVLVGQAAPELVEEILARVWGNEETAICLSSDLSHFLRDDAARALDAQTRNLIEAGHWQALEGNNACGYVALRGALKRAQALRMRVTGTHFTNSAAAGGGTDRVVGYGAFAFEYPGVAQFDQDSRESMLSVAGAALRFAVARNGQVPNIVAGPCVSPVMTAQRATFVTLELEGQLRGCVGSVWPQRPLIDDIGANAVKAGFADHRFARLPPDELERLVIKISVLSPLAPLTFAHESDLLRQLQPDRDGLLIQEGHTAALFLPSVWSQIPEPRDFLAHLKMKMGKAPDHWSSALQAYRFTVESFGGPIPPNQGYHLDGISIQP